jgi:peptidoglycan/LPS O-acetylase OafA/YrhL
MAWFHKGPFSFQLSFPGLYAVYFAAGIVLGARGLDGSPITASLARHWKTWAAAGALTFPIWLFASAKAFVNPAAASPEWNFASAVTLVPACLASSCFALALSLRFAPTRRRALESLQRNAYAIYLVHCVFVVWAQYALLTTDWPAVVKGSIVFVMTLTLSWATAASLRRVPGLAIVIGAGGGAVPRIVQPIHARSVVLPD